MKKYYIAIQKLVILQTIILFLINIVNSQINIQVSGGIDLSTVSYDGPDVINPQIFKGYHLELNFQHELGENFNLNILGQYLSRGYLIKNSNGSGVKRNYIDLQPELSFKPLINTEIGIGLYFGVLHSFYSKSSNGDWQNLADIGITDKNDHGLSFLIRQSINHVVLYLRYKYGIQKLNEIMYTDINGNPIGSSTEKNRQIQIGIGYNFNIKKKKIVVDQN
jgi:hypothetical protein